MIAPMTSMFAAALAAGALHVETALAQTEGGQAVTELNEVEARNKAFRAHAFFDSVVFNDFWRRVKPAE